MITVTTTSNDYKGEKDTKFSDVSKAVRFIRMMRRMGYRVIGYSCYDPGDNEILARA